MRLFLLWLFLHGPFTAFAAKNGAVICLNFDNLEFVKIMNNKGDPQFPDYKCEDFVSFDLLAGDVLRLSPTHIANIDILASKESPKDAGVDFNFNHLSFGFDKRYPEHKASVETIFIHELGHNIFTEYLYQNLPQLRVLNTLRQSNAGSSKLLANFISLVDQSGKCSSEKCLEFVEKYGEQIESSQIISNQIHEWHIKNNDLSNKLHIIMAPYHEFVADVVVMLFTHEPNAIRIAINEVVGIDVACRDFNYDAKTIREEYGPHCVFSGVRKNLLLNVILPAIKNKTESMALEKIMSVVTLEIRTELEKAISTPHWKFDRQRAFERLKAVLE